MSAAARASSSSARAGSSVPAHGSPSSTRERGLPAGFRAAGVAGRAQAGGGAGRRAARRATSPRRTSAARFTASARARPRPCWSPGSAPAGRAARGRASTRGNANAATGRRGLDEAARDAGRRGDGRAASTRTQVAVCSTGVIGVPARRRARSSPGCCEAGERAARRRRRRLRSGDHDHRRRSRSARRSTSTLPCGHGPADRAGQGRRDDLSRASRRCSASSRPTPRCAAETADLLLGVCVKRSFDRISVDGQLSTNDTVILQCSGASRRRASRPRARTSCAFGQALDALLRQLALAIVADGEGARRVGRVVVRGGNAGGVEARRARRRQLAARQDRAARRRPELGPHRPGRRRRAGRQRRRCRSTSRSRACRSRRPARRVAPTTSRASAALVDRPRGRVRRRAARRRRTRPRSSSPTSATTT